jgi:hypothetical protein
VGHRAWLGTFSNLGYYIPSRHEKAVENEKKDIYTSKQRTTW